MKNKLQKETKTKKGFNPFKKFGSKLETGVLGSDPSKNLAGMTNVLRGLMTVRYFWMVIRYRAHLRLRGVHDRLFMKRRLYFRYHSLPYARHINRMGRISFVITFAVCFWLNYNYLFKPNHTYAASVYNWVQNSWAGGADTTNFPSHPTNQSNWTKYNSKDNSVTANSTSVALSQASSSFADSADADFDAGTKTNVGVHSGALLLKPNGATAANTWECSSGYVSGGVCVIDPWASAYNGRAGSVLAGKKVWTTDISGTKQWKTAGTSCVGPQCATGLDTSYPSNYVLVADNAQDFSAYPARDACKTLGGRLPTKPELLELYSYKVANYGNNFQSGIYWSATEYSSNYAYFVSFSNGYTNGFNKTSSLYVRCVRG